MEPVRVSVATPAPVRHHDWRQVCVSSETRSFRRGHMPENDAFMSSRARPYGGWQSVCGGVEGRGFLVPDGERYKRRSRRDAQNSGALIKANADRASTTTITFGGGGDLRSRGLCCGVYLRGIALVHDRRRCSRRCGWFHRRQVLTSIIRSTGICSAPSPAARVIVDPQVLGFSPPCSLCEVIKCGTDVPSPTLFGERVARAR